MVKGEDSHSKGCGFESRYCILDGHDIFHIDLYEKTKKKRKKAGIGPFFFKKSLF